jgi:hypothetical protein
VLGIYNEAVNELAINSQERNLTGVHPANETYTESGGGVYVKNKSCDTMPMELYYLYKSEGDHVSLRFGPTNEEVEVHTVGVRLMPKLADGVTASIEAAYQTGEQGDVDLEGVMVDAAVKCNLPIMEDKNPALSAGVYYLSGDDADTMDENESWIPLWGRWPQYSELYIYSYDANPDGPWRNLMMPHVSLTMANKTGCKAKAMVGYMTAPEEDGAGGGDERGWLGVVRADFTLAKSVVRENDKVFGHVTAEVIDPGDYYPDDMDTGYFIRWELSYAF